MKGVLLPVVPRSGEDGLPAGAPVEPAKLSYLLDKYGDLLADTVVCFEERPEIVELILKYGKQVVPAIVGDELNFAHNALNDWEQTGFKADWIHWVLDNVQRFEGVLLGNCVLEVTNHHAGQSTATADIVGSLCEKFPALAGKLRLAPWHIDVARDMGTSGFPLRAALQQAGPWHMVYWGYEFLEAEPPGMREWFQGLSVYSGIHYWKGASEHNLNRLRGLGFAGALFFLPVYQPRTRADARMHLYLTDVRERV